MIDLRGKSILVVDDDPLLRQVLAEAFELVAAKTFQAAGGRAALELLRNTPVDAVVSDIRMPDGDGIELLGSIAKLTEPRPIVILVSGFSDLSEAKALELGAVALLQKPFRTRDLFKLVTRLLKLQPPSGTA